MATKQYTYKDIDPAFDLNPNSKDITVRTDERAIKFALKSLIITNFYERPFNPALGGNLLGLLFENTSSDADVISNQIIRNLILNYEPRVTPINISTTMGHDSNSVAISITFKIKNISTEYTVDVILKRTR